MYSDKEKIELFIKFMKNLKNLEYDGWDYYDPTFFMEQASRLFDLNGYKDFPLLDERKEENIPHYNVKIIGRCLVVELHFEGSVITELFCEDERKSDLIYTWEMDYASFPASINLTKMIVERK